MFGFLFTCLASCALVKDVINGTGSTGREPEYEEKEEELDAVVGTRVWDPYKKQWVTGDEKSIEFETVDTVSWKENTTTERPLITESPAPRDPFAAKPAPAEEANRLTSNALPAGSRGKIALLLPFLGSGFDPAMPTLNPNSTWAIQYYAGTMLALDSLSKLGISLDVIVLDSDGSQTTVGSLIASNPELQQSNMIIGPYRRDNVRLLAPFAKQWEVPLVSPYTASDDITTDNPWYIQVSPSLATHCQQMAFDALSFARPDQLVLVAREDAAEKQRLSFFQEAYFLKEGSRSVPPLEEMVVQDASADLKDLSLSPYIRRGATTVFLIPVADETFVYSFLRKLELARNPDDIVRVYGLPQWIDFEYVDPQYFADLDVHVSSNFYINPDDPDVKNFNRKFIEAYAQVPRQEAYLGFDVMYYFGQLLYYYGKDAAYEMTGKPASLLHTQFRFEPVVIPTTTGAEQLPIQRYENKFLHILNFQDYLFAPTNN